jgi:hypothetical protein
MIKIVKFMKFFKEKVKSLWYKFNVLRLYIIKLIIWFQLQKIQKVFFHDVDSGWGKSDFKDCS